MNKSASISKISQALVKAQAEMPVVKMNAVNPFLKNKYADLGAVIESSRQTLAKYGLAIAQTPVSDGDKIGLTTLLVHESGEWLEETIYINTSDGKGLSNAQNVGVVISYLRRYSWAAILGLYADEDTDGNKSQDSAKKSSPMTIEQARALKTSDGKLYGDLTRDDLERIANNANAPEEKKRAARLIIADLINEGK